MPSKRPLFPPIAPEALNDTEDSFRKVPGASRSVPHPRGAWAHRSGSILFNIHTRTYWRQRWESLIRFRIVYLTFFSSLEFLSVPSNRYTPLKQNWEKIYTPIVEHLKLQVRFNLQTRNVEIKTCEETKSVGSYWDHVCVITGGFSLVLRFFFFQSFLSWLFNSLLLLWPCYSFHTHLFSPSPPSVLAILPWSQLTRLSWFLVHRLATKGGRLRARFYFGFRRGRRLGLSASRRSVPRVVQSDGRERTQGRPSFSRHRPHRRIPRQNQVHHRKRVQSAHRTRRLPSSSVGVVSKHSLSQTFHLFLDYGQSPQQSLRQYEGVRFQVGLPFLNDIRLSFLASLLLRVGLFGGNETKKEKKISMLRHHLVTARHNNEKVVIFSSPLTSFQMSVLCWIPENVALGLAQEGYSQLTMTLTVIGVGGVSCGGKTTIAKRLVQKLQVRLWVAKIFCFTFVGVCSPRPYLNQLDTWTFSRFRGFSQPQKSIFVVGC